MADPGHEDHEIAGAHAVPPGEVHVHIHPTKLYAGILGALLFLTVVTVAVSYVDIDGFLAMGREVEGVGAWNLGVAILVATMKATLVVLFFMHLKDDARFNALVFVGALLFIGVFFAYTMNDTGTRGETGDAFNGVTIDPETGLRAPGGITGEIHGQALEEGIPVEEEEPAAEAPEASATDAAELSEEGEALAEEASGAEAMEEVVEGAAEELGDAVGAEPDVEPAELAEEEPAPEAAEPEAPAQPRGAAPAQGAAQPRRPAQGAAPAPEARRPTGAAAAQKAPAAEPEAEPEGE